MAIVLLLSMLLLSCDASEVRKYGELNSREELVQYKDYRGILSQLPTVLYNLCALYYVSPECLGEMFGEEFDIASVVEQFCPM